MASEWISAKDRLPDKLPNSEGGWPQAATVLAVCREWYQTPRFGSYWHDLEIWRLEGSNSDEPVTHWMPVPEMPAG